MEQLIFNDEMILAQTPEPINVIGLGMGGPVVITHGTEEQKKRYLAASSVSRGDLVPGLQRAQRGQRPVRAADAG